MKKGFTLIELLAVVLIMGILASVAMPKYTRSLDRARMVEAEQMLAPIYEARERVRIENEANGNNETITANMLDIGIKNITSIEGQLIRTPNYTYSIANENVVQARLEKGNNVKGTVFAYDGTNMYCCNPGKTDTGKTDICEEVFNISKKHCF
ncbi:type IV pilin protein [Candidatus Avelusimicrobium faecicola]|uniref:type IV pilin protein n=1 Tax=Candidatus Avelusimicrobium faecicola TaxID=3416205 RepID=UPI003D0C81DF